MLSFSPWETLWAEGSLLALSWPLCGMWAKRTVPLTLLSASVLGFFAALFCWNFFLDSWPPTKVLLFVGNGQNWCSVGDDGSKLFCFADITLPLFLSKRLIFIHVM